MAEYKIGRFEFDTYEEYVRGMADVRNIEKITHSVDIYDPDTALRLYQSIKSGRIKIYSKIGRRFFLDLADIVVEHASQAGREEKQEQKSSKRQGKKRDSAKKGWQSKGLLSGKEKTERKRDRNPAEQQSTAEDRSRRILGGVCFVAAIACFAWYFWSDYTNHRGNKVNDYLKSLRENAQENVELISNDEFFLEDAPELAAVEGAEEESGGDITRTVLPEYEAILQENKDFAGWIIIDGTKIDYPVVLTKGDNEYYLARNFNGQSDINGTLFMDGRTNLGNRSTNIIIYGHNMKSGEMFGDLKKYLDEEYWNSHRQITFDTIYEKGTYEIFAVCLAQVQYRNTEGFRYYDFIQADTEEEFAEFLDNIVQLSVFAGTDLPVYGDELLTLSTCNNFAEDGRLFLVAKKCRDAE